VFLLSLRNSRQRASLFSPVVDHHIDERRNSEDQNIIDPREGCPPLAIGSIAVTLVDLLFMPHDSALYFHVFPTHVVHVQALVQWCNQCFLDLGEYIPSRYILYVSFTLPYFKKSVLRMKIRDCTC
jgi:hypothetical protein